VAFEVGSPADEEMDLGFKDIPVPEAEEEIPEIPESPAEIISEPEKPAKTTATPRKQTPKKTTGPPRKRGRPRKEDVARRLAEQEAAAPADEDEDDEKCAICGNGDSAPPNQILFCDSCDLAVHQVCYNVPVVPGGDWFCEDCQPVEVEEIVEEAEDGGAAIAEEGEEESDIVAPIAPMVPSHEVELPDIEGFADHLRMTQKLLLDKLTGRKRLKLQGLDDEYQKVHQVVEQTVLAGEGNSMLVIGARSSGKTSLVDSVIDDISAEHRDKFHVVRLNGFMHTDDKLALRDTWRQLGREMEVDDDLTSKTNNYADTLSSLLALLSHNSESDDSNTASKSVVFVLEEFDLFTQHPRQTLLYNLFDIAQARKAPIAVLGLTTKIDVVEALEKRVKSRFSHRYVHLPLPKSFPAFWEICKQGLVIDLDEIVEAGLDPGEPGLEGFLEYWADAINVCISHETLLRKSTWD
jgi:origin recognition complex subunit 4